MTLPYVFITSGKGTYIVGDDPFTDGIEPSVPFTLGVAVRNAGHGTAHSLKITSGDPQLSICLLYTSPSPRDATLSRMPSSA